MSETDDLDQRYPADDREEIIESSPLIQVFGDHPRARIIRALLYEHPNPLNPSSIIDAAGLGARSSWYDHKETLLETGLVVERWRAGNSTLYGLPLADDGRVEAIKRLNELTGHALYHGSDTP